MKLNLFLLAKTENEKILDVISPRQKTIRSVKSATQEMLLYVWEKVDFRLNADNETMEFLSSYKCKNSIKELTFLVNIHMI